MIYQPETFLREVYATKHRAENRGSSPWRFHEILKQGYHVQVYTNSITVKTACRYICGKPKRDRIPSKPIGG
jgi:hypothetical protein